MMSCYIPAQGYGQGQSVHETVMIRLNNPGDDLQSDPNQDYRKSSLHCCNLTNKESASLLRPVLA